MVIYRYALHNEAGPNEHLGFINLLNDSEAMDFGSEVLADIIEEPDPAYQTASLEITEGTRQVRSLPLLVEVRRRTTASKLRS
ncbi:MAG: hypothetical protein Q7T81_14750 [Pseudolabrys sp.]|nr:hypothetical protein [Pseudolabrys sp.]